MKNYLQKSLLFTALLITAACSQEVQLNEKINQGLKYKLISKNQVVADGFSDLVVVLKVTDSDDNIVAGITPNVDVGNSASSSVGVNAATCSASDASGLSTCTFRSTLDGPKEIDIIGASPAGDTEFEIVFLPPPSNNGSNFQIVASAKAPETQGNGDTIISSVGNFIDSPRQVLSNGDLLKADVAVQE